MFGGNRRKKDENSLAAAMSPENAPAKGGGGGSVTGFDPEGLERAAKAARELDASRNATSAIELIKTQEATKQVRRWISCVAMSFRSFGLICLVPWYTISLSSHHFSTNIHSEFHVFSFISRSTTCCIMWRLI